MKDEEGAFIAYALRAIKKGEEVGPAAVLMSSFNAISGHWRLTMAWLI